MINRCRLSPSLSIATGGSVRDIIHSVTSIRQSFVYKCNNRNSCKLFYLNYKSILIHKLPQTPYTAFPLAGLSAGKYSLFCIQQMYFVMSNGPCLETKYITDLESFPFMSPICVCTSVLSLRDRKHPAGQVCIREALSKLAKYERDSGKWKMLQINVATYTAIPIPQRARADEELMHPLAWWRNSEPCLNRTPCRNTTGSVCLHMTF